MKIDKFVMQKKDFEGCESGSSVLMITDYVDQEENVFQARYQGDTKTGNPVIVHRGVRDNIEITEIMEWICLKRLSQRRLTLMPHHPAYSKVESFLERYMKLDCKKIGVRLK